MFNHMAANNQIPLVFRFEGENVPQNIVDVWIVIFLNSYHPISISMRPPIYAPFLLVFSFVLLKNPLVFIWLKP